MNEQTSTQTQNDSKFAKARRFTGRHRTLVIAGAAGAILLGGGTAAAFAADDDAFEAENSGGAQTGTSTEAPTGGEEPSPGGEEPSPGGEEPSPGGDDWDDDDDRGGDWDDAWDDRGDDDDFVLPDNAIGEDAAVEAALAEVDGTVRDVDLEGNVDQPVWVIDITDADGVEWDVAVNALDGSILGSQQDDDSDDDHDDDRHDDDDDWGDDD